MSIIIDMNIYITEQNTALLRKEASMSGLINKLLNEHYGNLPELSISTGGNLIVDGGLRDKPEQVNIVHEYAEKAAEAWAPKPPDPETGYPCCTKSKPCKHWIWNGEEQAYINELTGEIKEV